MAEALYGPRSLETDSPLYKGYKSVMIFAKIKKRDFKDEVFTLPFMSKDGFAPIMMSQDSRPSLRFSGHRRKVQDQEYLQTLAYLLFILAPCLPPLAHWSPVHAEEYTFDSLRG